MQVIGHLESFCDSQNSGCVPSSERLEEIVLLTDPIQLGGHLIHFEPFNEQTALSKD